MIASNRQVAILTNWGNDDDVTVSFRGSFGSVVDILSGAVIQTKIEDDNKSTLATLHLAKDSVVVLVAQ